MGEASDGGGVTAYRDTAGGSALLQPHAMPKVLEPRVRPQECVGRIAVDRRQRDIPVRERSLQPGYGLFPPAELGILVGETDRPNESALPLDLQPREGAAGSEQPRRRVPAPAPAPPDQTPECGIARLTISRDELVGGRVIVALARERLRE